MDAPWPGTVVLLPIPPMPTTSSKAHAVCFPKTTIQHHTTEERIENSRGFTDDNILKFVGRSRGASRVVLMVQYTLAFGAIWYAAQTK